MYCILAWAIIGAASAVCGPETCAVVGPSLPLNCQGTIIKNTGYCGCYDACAKQAGESCQARPGLDGRTTYGTCEPHLICVPHGEMVSLGYGRCHIPLRTARWLTSMTHNTPCEQMRRARLLSMAVWQGEWTPVCDTLGNFHVHQCDNIGQCFCVETHTGKMLTTKTLGAVDCSGKQEVTHEITTTMIPTKAPAARFLDMTHNTPCEQERRARLMSMVVRQGQWVPVCDSQGNYLPHQCDNMGHCFFVDINSGKMLTAKSLSAVDCSSQPEVGVAVTMPTKAPAARFLDMPHNTPCEQQRRARLMSMVVWQGEWVPVCDSQGNYLPHQCDNMGQCFCVETTKGTLLTEKSSGSVDCTGQQL